MRIACSFCKKELGEKEPFDDERISHGICRECHSYFTAQLQGLTLDEYLDGFQAPVLILNSEGRVVAANTMAAVQLRRRNPEDAQGFLGGEVMECSYARLEEGCGKTIHCSTCTIRNLVMQTLQSKQGVSDMVVTLNTDSGHSQLVISTSYVDGLVRIMIGDMQLTNSPEE